MLNSELYSKAADIIESGWTQGVYARDEDGCSVYPQKKTAKSWCLTGALFAVAYTTDKCISYGLIVDNLIENLALEDTPGMWNDSPDRTQEQVVTLLRRAAARSVLEEGR